MPELWHQWSSDLVLSSTGDLLIADGTDEGQQRVLRRLLTNPGDYIYHVANGTTPAYGAGLPGKVGSTIDAKAIQALCQSQMYLEQAVARTPAPQIDVTAIQNGIFVAIEYADFQTGQPVIVTFNING